jgi:hypothetical protein
MCNRLSSKSAVHKMLQESVGLGKSKRKFGWARTDSVDFAGHQLFCCPQKRRDKDRPDGFAANLPLSPTDS